MLTIVKPIQTSSKYRDVKCKDCALHLICLPPSVDESELARLDEIIERGQPLSRGDELFHQGDTFDKVFAIRSGAIKSTVMLGNGIEQVTGFYFPGDIVGLESIGNKQYVNSAFALEPTNLCAIPYTNLRSLTQVIPSFQDHIFGLISNEVRQSHQMHLAISKMTAQERIAIFILSISVRYRRRRLSEDSLHLPMSRSDIANFLGLTIETVSRVFSNLQAQDILDVRGRHINILNRTELCEILGYANDSLIN